MISYASNEERKKSAHYKKKKKNIEDIFQSNWTLHEEN